MSMTPSSQADNFRMQHSDDSSTEYDDTVVRPTVDKCLENFKKLKRKYVDLERAHILLQAKLKSSEDVKSSENETSFEKTMNHAERLTVSLSIVNSFVV